MQASMGRFAVRLVGWARRRSGSGVRSERGLIAQVKDVVFPNPQPITDHTRPPDERHITDAKPAVHGLWLAPVNVLASILLTVGPWRR
jgi:hypothetical protein